MKSAAKKPSSVILQRYSRAGWDIECQPIAYHLPVHQAMLEVSDLNSRVRARAMTSLKNHRCIATTATMPRRALAKIQPSRKNITSQKARSMKTATP